MLECLQNACVVQNHKDDTEAIEVFLALSVDAQHLQELKTELSIVEALNLDYRLKEEDLLVIF